MCEHDFCLDAKVQNPSQLLTKVGNSIYEKVWRECCKCQSQVSRARLPVYEGT